MPTFRPPDIDPTLTQEAQQVVNQASAQMDAWLTDSFAQLEREFEQGLETLKQQLETEKQAFIDEEKRRSEQLLSQLQQLKSASQYLTPMDPDQEQVIKQLANITEQAQQDLIAKQERWQHFGSTVVNIAHSGLKTLIKGAL